jgi:ureidoglycolate dehydrogenase (NAD+)
MPLGGPQYGHKGYGLALLVELLCGALHGNPSAPNLPTVTTQLDAPSRRGAFFIVLDPLRFAGGPGFAAAVAAFAAALAAEPGAPRMPGDPELAHQAQRRAAGIPVEPGLLAQMRAWSERLHVAAPA